MIPVQNVSYFIALNPTSTAGGATATSSIFDMQGFEEATIEVEGLIDTPPTVLKVQTNDLPSTTGMADDPYLVGGGALGFPLPASLPTQLGNAPSMVIDADWRSRKRYGQVVVSPGASAANLSIRVIRSRANISPITASGKNVSAYASA